MAITMMQLLTGLVGFVGCLVLLSLLRIIFGLSAALTAISVTGNDGSLCDDGRESAHIETICLLIILCIHLTMNFLFGRVTPGNLNYSLTADIFDWIWSVTEYIMAIHLLGYFKDLSNCIESTDGLSISSYTNDPNIVWDLLVTWITFDSILFLFKILISYLIFRKFKSRRYQTKYVLQ